MESKFEILKVLRLTKYFNVKMGLGNKKLFALDKINFSLNKGETLGLAGESGCGKTTLGKCIVNLYKPDDGKIYFNKKDILKFPRREMRLARKNIQLIMQDPYSSLNPRWNVMGTVEEPLINYKVGSKKERLDRVRYLLSVVGLPLNFTKFYPHQMSGGQRQRVAIARSIATNPELLICDEVVSALDVSVQAQILNLFLELQEKFNLSMIFISHNLAVVKHISHKVAIMYLGKIVEIGNSEKLFTNPLHPYTKGLISSILTLDPKIEKKRKKLVLKGDVPSPINLPIGCRFYKRCNYVKDICLKVNPELKEVENDYSVACHLYDL